MTAAAVSPLALAYEQSRVGVHVVRAASERPAPEGWREWLLELFPKHVRHPFAPRHEQLWAHVWSIDYPTAPRPFVAVWARGGGKSTSAELAAAALGCRGARRYGLYVRGKQDLADDSVTNIAALLEAPTVEMYYPSHGRPMLGKHGSSRGWRRSRIRTAGGFTMDAIGLDTLARGAKIEDQRPDLIILDDIDEKHDTTAVTAKKITTITTSILPAGSDNVAILAIQNLIIPDGFFTRMVDGRAEYLARRIVSGPFPAITRLETEWREDAETGTRRAIIVHGSATWAGQSLATCQKQIDEWGLPAFEKEAQHKVFERPEGLALDFDPLEHLLDATPEDVRTLVQLGQAFGGVDFGSWRFAFTAWAADTSGVAVRIEEIFSQREEHAVRAKRIHDACEALGIVRGERLAIGKFPIWGDAANPQDITELNAAWKRGWRDPVTGRLIRSPLRVVAVGMESKLRAASVERMNTKLGERAVRFVRSVGAGHTWMLGANAGTDGTPMKGSRLMWEIGKWSFPIPQEGKAQKQDPDDHTADGADMIASARYALMSWWRPGKQKDDEDVSAFSPDVLEADHDRAYRLRYRKQKRRSGVLDPHFGEY